MKPELKKEALRRMRLLRLMNNGFDSPVGDFNLNETAWKSEYYGILYYLDKQEKKIIADFEKKFSKYGMKVYHCYRAKREFGDILYLLFVSEEPEDSSYNFDNNLRNGIVYLYAYNISEPLFSEFGTAYINSQYGGIVIR